MWNGRSIFVFGVSTGVLVIAWVLLGIAHGMGPLGSALLELLGVCVALAAAIYRWLYLRHPDDLYELAARRVDRRTHELTTGEKLAAGRSICSPNGRHVLQVGLDGNVIEWGDGMVAMWKTGTDHSGEDSFLTLKPGGELAVCRRDGSEVKVVPGTENCGGTKLILQDDAQLVLLRPDNSIAWRTGLAIG